MCRNLLLSVIAAIVFAPMLQAQHSPAVPSVSRLHAQTGSVVDGDARFTVITPTLVRMEFSRDRRFIDRRSYFAWSRDVAAPPFEVRRTPEGLKISTSRLRLTWKGGQGGFNATNLSIQFLNPGGLWKTWRPGDRQTGNLGGTLKSLDGCSGRQPLPDGVVSRDGWFVYRDTTPLISDGARPWGTHGWIEPRPASETSDWYFFGYGKNDYRTALEDLTTISGKHSHSASFHAWNLALALFQLQRSPIQRAGQTVQRTPVPA